MALFVSALTLVPGALAAKASGQGRKAACGLGDLACSAEAIPAFGPQSETLLVQLHGLSQRASASSVAVASANTGSAVAAHIRGFFSNMLNAGNALRAGFVAVMDSLPLFIDGDVLDGLSVLAHGLMDALRFVLPTNVTESAAFATFQDTWRRVSEALPELAATVSAGVRAFKEEGDVVALLRSTLFVIQDIGPSAMQYLPDEVSIEVAKYLGAVEDALEGFEQAMDVYSTGNATEAIWEMYLGLRTAVGGLVSEDLLSNENFTVIVDVIDSTIGDLSAIVLRFKQQLLQASACWKAHTSREKVRPDVCPSNHRFDGSHWCFAEGSSPPVQIKSRSGICVSSQKGWSTGRVQIGGYVQMSACEGSSLQQQWFFDNVTGHIMNTRGRCLDAGAEGSKVRAVVCRDDDPNQEWEYVESDGSIKTKGGMCLEAPQYTKERARVRSNACDSAAESQRWELPAGGTSLLDVTLARKTGPNIVAPICDQRTPFKEQVGPWCYKGCPAGTEAAGARCRTKCEGAFPVSASLMCATSYRTLAIALHEMAAQSLKTGIDAKSMISSTGLAGGLHHTIDALVEMALSFTYPTCPQQS